MSKHTLVKVLLGLQGWVVIFVLFFSILDFGGFEERAIYVTHLCLAFSLFIQALLLCLENHYFSDFNPAIRLPLLSFGLFLIFACVQFFWGVALLQGSPAGSVYPYITFEAVFQLTCYVIFFLICAKLTSNRVYVERLASLIAVLAFVVTTLGLAQRLITSRSILWRIHPDYSSLSFGPFINENHFGGFLSLAFPLALGVMHYRFRQVKQAFTSDFSKTTKQTPWKSWMALIDNGTAFLFLLLIFTLGACFFALARVSSVVLLFCCVAYFVIYGINKRNFKFYLTLFIILLGSFFLVTQLGYDTVAVRFGINELWSSWNDRMVIAQQSLAIFYEFPLFGTGLGTYPWISAKAVSVMANFIWWNHIHNDYVELLTDTGVFGFFFFLSAILFIMFISLNQNKKNNSLWSKSMVNQGIIAMICIGVMEFSDFHLRIPSIAFFFSLQLALLIQCSTPLDRVRSDTFRQNKSFRNQFLNWMLAFGCFILAVYLLFVSFRMHQAKQWLRFPGNRLTYLERAVELEPTYAELWYQLAGEYQKNLKKVSDQPKLSFPIKKKMISALEKAVSLSPTQSRFWFQLGRLQYSIGLKKEGIESLEKAVYWAPAKLNYSLYLTGLYLRENEEEKALNLYRRLKHLDPKPTESESQLWMGERYYSKLKDLERWSLPSTNG